MAGFDPSVIAQIGQSGPNIPAAQQAARTSAITMQDALDEEQLNRLQLSGAEQQSAREARIRQLLSGPDVDVSTPQGVTKAAEKLTQGGFAPEAMSLMKSGQSLQTGETQNKLSQYALLSAHNDILGNAAGALLSKYNALVKGGTSPALASMLMQPQYQDTLKQLSQQRLPDGTPALDTNHPKAIADHPTFDASFARTVAMNSTKSRQALQAQMGMLKDQAEIENADARTKAIQSGKLVPVETQDGTVVYAPASQAAGAKVGKTSSFGIQQPTTPAGQDLERSLSELGDRISYGQIRMMNFDQIAADPKYQGMSADQIAQDVVSNTQHTAAAQQVRIAFDKGRQGDTVRSLNVAIQHLGVLSRLGANLRNGDTRSVNAFYQELGKQFGTAAPTNFDFAKDIVGDEVVKSVISSGAGTVTDRTQLQDAFSKASSPEQLAGVVQTAESLMGGQLAGLRDQYVSGLTGVSSARAAAKEFEQKLNPVTRRTLESRSATGSSGATRVTSQAQYDALPKGTRYVGPDGKTRTKS